jgi:hypothetical protein
MTTTTTETITSPYEIARIKAALADALRELDRIAQLRADLFVALSERDVIKAVTLTGDLGSPRHMTEFFVKRAMEYLTTEADND